MRAISYTISGELKETLNAIEAKRQEILLAPISHKNERRLRFEAALHRLTYAGQLMNLTLHKKDIVRLVSNPFSKEKSRDLQLLFRYKRALDFLFNEWYVSGKGVTLRVTGQIHEMVSRGTLQASGKSFGAVLEYLNVSQDHPVVLAGVAHMQCIAHAPFSHGNDSLSFLLSYLYLYKSGYDCRGFLALEQYWKETPRLYARSMERSQKDPTITIWLEYFAKGVLEQLTNALETIANRNSQTDLPSSFWELSDRQKAILALMDNPDETMTNRRVQKQCKISQITASRDLAKLASLGLLFPHGKGRSVYYTKV